MLPGNLVRTRLLTALGEVNVEVVLVAELIREISFWIFHTFADTVEQMFIN